VPTQPQENGPEPLTPIRGVRSADVMERKTSYQTSIKGEDKSSLIFFLLNKQAPILDPLVTPP
jgi:hypothetical protein